MASREHAVIPRVTILQLDTHFPRIKGDIGCAQTFNVLPEILVLPDFTVSRVVTDRAAYLDLEPLIAAVKRAKGDVITTSCGFLAPFEKVLSQETARPVLTSSLNALGTSLLPHDLSETQVLTFNAEALGPQLFPKGVYNGLAPSIGLPQEAHLRQVIENDLRYLDAKRAEAEIIQLLEEQLLDTTKMLVLECTNLPPYKRVVREAFGIEIFDLLDRIEGFAKGAIATT